MTSVSWRKRAAVVEKLFKYVGQYHSCSFGFLLLTQHVLFGKLNYRLMNDSFGNSCICIESMVIKI